MNIDIDKKATYKTYRSRKWETVYPEKKNVTECRGPWQMGGSMKNRVAQESLMERMREELHTDSGKMGCFRLR